MSCHLYFSVTNESILLYFYESIDMMSVSVYSFKSMVYAVDNAYLPENLSCRYIPSNLLGKGACGEVRLAYDKVSFI